MAAQYLQIARILMTPEVTKVPRAVLGELARRGHRRLPEDVQGSLSRVLPGLRGLRFVQRWLDGELITRHDGKWVINSFLPPFPGPAFDRMFQNLLSGRRLSPVSAFLALTSECPYQCWHCSYKKRPPGSLSTDEWSRVVAELQNLGASIIGFTGGEPCSRPDLPEIVAAASKGGASTILFSSGACMDEPLLRRLKAAGLWSVCISLDHPNSAIHDKLRGAPGAHARALQMLRCASALGFYTMVGAVGRRDLIPFLPELRAFARANGAHELRIVEPMPCGLLASSHSALLNESETTALRRFHVASNKTGALPKVCAFNQIESPEVFGCGAGTQHMFIDARGEVCPCDFTGMSFGRVPAEPLATVWGRMSDAMRHPRRHCFVRKHHAIITKYSNGTFPLSPELSMRVCAEAGVEELPDYFQQMLGKKTV